MSFADNSAIVNARAKKKRMNFLMVKDERRSSSSSFCAIIFTWRYLLSNNFRQTKHGISILCDASPQQANTQWRSHAWWLAQAKKRRWKKMFHWWKAAKNKPRIIIYGLRPLTISARNEIEIGWLSDRARQKATNQTPETHKREKRTSKTIPRRY